MYCTRDINGDIELWNVNNRKAVYKEDGYWFVDAMCDYIVLTDEGFRWLFPTERLPRKGSCTYISHLKIVKG